MSHNLNRRQGAYLMAYRGELPWHREGTKMSDDCTWDDMAERSGIRRVRAVSRNVYLGGPSVSPIPGYQAIVDEETEAVFHIGGRRYTIVQYDDAFSLPAALLDQRVIEPETAGVLGVGERAWALFKVQGASSESELIRFDGTPDTLESYLLATAAHDGSGSILFGGTSTRVVCQNTLGFALGDRSGKRLSYSISVKHTKNAHKRIEDAHALLTALLAGREAFMAEMETLDRHLMPLDRATQFFCDWADETYGEIDERLDFRSLRAAREKRMQLIETLADGFRNGPGNKGTTPYDALQAVTDFIDHQRGRGTDHTQRFNRLMFGAGDAAKKRAHQTLLAWTRDGKVERIRR